MAVVANKPDIVCIVEYWLCGYISANEVALPGYQVYMSVTKLDNEAVYIAIVSCEERRDSDDITTMQVNHGGISIETTCVCSVKNINHHFSNIQSPDGTADLHLHKTASHCVLLQQTVFCHALNTSPITNHIAINT